MTVTLDEAKKRLEGKYSNIIVQTKHVLRATLFPIPSDSKHMYHQVDIIYDGQLRIERVILRSKSTSEEIKNQTSDWLKIPQIKKKIDEVIQVLDP